MLTFRQTQSAYLPVTALCVLHNEDRLLLLAGQGPFLHVYDLATNGKLSSLRVFEVQAIHGIAFPSQSFADAVGSRFEIAAVGGNLVALVRLSAAIEPLLERTAFFQLDDWILKICHYQLHDHSECFALLTAKNTLLQLECGNDQDSKATMKPITQGPKSFLYSGDICSASEDKLIVAGGSAFGEILVWTSQHDAIASTWASVTMHRFDAHNGSTFGIRVSQPIIVDGRATRMVASCSDDRQIQIRDIGGSDSRRIINGTERTRGTGFGNHTQSDSSLIAAAWGHQSRIWDIDFVQSLSNENNGIVQLISRGEDASCQSWSLMLWRNSVDSRVTGELRLDSLDRHHAGKNAWSFTHFRSHASAALISGGADGKLVKRTLPNHENVQTRNSILTMPFKDIPVAVFSKVMKEYLITDQTSVVSLTNSGELLLSEHGHGMQPTWDLRATLSDSKIVKLCDSCPSGLVIAATTSSVLIGRPSITERLAELQCSFPQPVSWLQMAGVAISDSSREEKLCLVATFPKGALAMAIFLEVATDAIELYRTLDLELPHSFIVTSSCFDFTSRGIILGSRSGSTAFFDTKEGHVDCRQAVSHIGGVHGSDAVTSVQYLPHRSSTSHEGTRHILTTGRDGAYAIHRISYLEVKGTGNLGFQTVHRSSTPIGQNIEKATFIKEKNELVLRGFKSTNFMVWNETKQITLASIDCGGAHRSWAYREQSSSGSAGMFVWTKAGAFNLVRTGTDKGEIIQHGSHGREIKAFAVSWMPLMITGVGECTLVATGAEDTEVRLFAVTRGEDNNSQQFKCLAVLRDHTVGPQCLAFSACGRYLVSSGGCEQLYVWRLTRDVPCIEVGVVLQDKMPRTEDDADVRIMSFQFVSGSRESDCDFQHRLTLAAAYSNGKVKIMHYEKSTSPHQGHFRFLTEVVFGSFCLTQVQVDPPMEGQKQIMVTAGTNGFLNLSKINFRQAGLVENHDFKVQKVHQNSITAMETVLLGHEMMLIVTGGDDNALGLTVAAICSDSGGQCRTLLIPKAHAAALTALTVVDTRRAGDIFRVTVVTAGNDQRLKVWDVSIRFNVGEGLNVFDDKLLDKVWVRKAYEGWTCVADVSDIGVVRSDRWVGRGELDVMVVGVGMEIVRLETESREQ